MGRITVRLEENIHDELDEVRDARDYDNRSELVRDLIKKGLQEIETKKEKLSRLKKERADLQQDLDSIQRQIDQLRSDVQTDEKKIRQARKRVKQIMGQQYVRWNGSIPKNMKGDVLDRIKRNTGVKMDDREVKQVMTDLEGVDDPQKYREVGKDITDEIFSKKLVKVPEE